jgi:hypothetical protein
MPFEIMAVAIRGDIVPPTLTSLAEDNYRLFGQPTPYNPCMKPSTTVPFVKFAIQAFETAKNKATPVPTNQNDNTTTGNGGVHIKAT